MYPGHDTVIHELLSRRGLVEPARLAQALEEHRSSGAPLAKVVLDCGLLDRGVFLKEVAGLAGAEAAGSVPDALPPGVLSLVPAEIARTHEVVPLAGDGRTVRVLAADPLDRHLASDLSFALGREVSIVVADPDEVRRLIRRHYGSDEDSTPPDALIGEVGAEAAAMSDAELEELAGRTPLIRFVNLILSRAIRAGASDIHFEPFQDEFRIRQRVDGTLCGLPSPPRALALPVVSRLKVLADLDIAERRMPQDGRIRITLGGRPVDLRVSTLPTQFGESVVLRILDPSAAALDIGQLGFADDTRESLDRVLRRPHGMLAVTGPTGSGKTTTLHGCLRRLNQPGRKLLTIEDPVEYEVEGVMQVAVNPAAGLTFASALRSFLRQDPDIVMVGEIRDTETARIAVQAALTGHFVLTTLHTNDAAGAIPRLADMGVEPYLLASSLEAVAAQRLVRRICRGCRVERAPRARALEIAGLPADALGGGPVFAGAGCAACNGTGYRGRMGIMELLVMTDELRELVASGQAAGALRRLALEQGMRSLRDDAHRAVRAGETTLEEIAVFC